MIACALCGNFLATVDRDNRSTVAGEVCGGCVRAHGAVMTGKIAELYHLWPDARTAVDVAFGHLKADDTTCEASCGYIEEWYRERGHDVSVHFTATYSIGHHGPTGVRFTLAPREPLRAVEFKFTVKV